MDAVRRRQPDWGQHGLCWRALIAALAARMGRTA